PGGTSSCWSAAVQWSAESPGKGDADGADIDAATASLQSVGMDPSARHLRLLTETIEAVNSTLDLEEVLALVARKVAEALDADSCFVYLYDERTNELVLRATHGTSVAAMTRRPRLRPGEGNTGAAPSRRE